MFAHSQILDPLESSKFPLEVLGAGSLLLVIITLIHGAGLDWIVGRFKKRSQALREKRRSPHLASFIFSYAILLMLFLHISELLIWGVVLNVSGLVPNLRDSVYFSANTYTTIGYGLMILPYNWRELSPIMAISGLFTFAWTTGQMFELVGNRRTLTEQLATLRGERKAPAVANPEPQQPVSAKTMDPEADLAPEECKQQVGLSAEQRLHLWREIEAKLQQLHAAEDHEIRSMRREHQ